MNQLDQDIEQARRNVAAAQERERERIAAIVQEATRETEIHAAEREAAERQAEQQQEAARVAWHAQREADAKAEAQRNYEVAGGDPAHFESWYIAERQRQVSERLANERAAMAYQTRRTF